MDELLLQYNNLSDSEKNALLVYKTRLGLLINDNYKNIEKYYDYYKELLNNPINMFVKMTIFKDIDLTNINSFKDSLIKIKETIIETLDKITSSKELTLYRAISIKKDEKLNDFSKSELMSTTMYFNECFKFIIQKPEYDHYIYQINLEKNSKVLPVPYSVLLNNETKQLILSKSDNQKEILILKDDYFFEQIDSKIMNLEKIDIKLVILNGKLKEKEKKL